MSWLGFYRLALRLLPRELRRKHGAAMGLLFVRELERVREGGWAARTSIGARGVMDVVRRSVYERLRRRVARIGVLSMAAGNRGKPNGVGPLRRDAGHALRALRRSPSFAVLAVLTLALGIGANGAIFSIVDAVLIRPLPFPRADRVVQLTWEGDGYLQRLSSVKYEYWRTRAGAFEGFATWQASSGWMEVGEGFESVQILGVSQDFLGVVGHAPALGRSFSPAEHAASQQEVALLAHSTWRSRFDSDAEIIGRTVRVNERLLTIIGVLPAEFTFPHEEEPADVVLPLRVIPDPASNAEDWPVIARLRDGVTGEVARREVASLTEPFRASHPEQVRDGDRGMRLATFTELYVPDGVRRSLWLLMAAVTLVFLIACANVTNLYLARASTRRGDLALRMALGGGLAQIARLLILEHVIVGLAAGGAGAVLAHWVSSVLVALSPVQVARLTEVAASGRMVLYTMTVAVLASMCCGLTAVAQSVRGLVWQSLREVTRGSGSDRVRQGLLLAQSALSMTLLVGAGLLLGTFKNLREADDGFDSGFLTAVRLPVAAPYRSTPLFTREKGQRVFERVAGSPFVASVAIASNLPFERGINTPVTVSGRPDLWGTIEWRAVTPSYFETLGIVIRSGRAFQATDDSAGSPVAIVNDSFERRFFSGGSALGQRIEVGSVRGVRTDATRPIDVVEIVGVVPDIREQSVRDEPRRTLYVPQAQAPARLGNVLGKPPVFIVRERSSGVHGGLAVARALADIDAHIANPEVTPIADLRSRTLVRERFGAVLLVLLAALALVLTALGIYGVLAYSVEQRRREIGIRMALGAAHDQVARTVTRQGVVPVLLGLALGVLISRSLARVIAGFLWGVQATDPAIIAAVATILLGVAIAAAWLPARRAAALDPVETLNHE